MIDPIKPSRKAIYAALEPLMPVYDTFVDGDQGVPYLVISSIRASVQAGTSCGPSSTVAVVIDVYDQNYVRGSMARNDNYAQPILDALLVPLQLDGIGEVTPRLTSMTGQGIMTESRALYSRTFNFEILIP